MLTIFKEKNPIIRIFRLSGWLAVPINPDHWNYTVCERNGVWKISKNAFGKIKYFIRLNVAAFTSFVMDEERGGGGCLFSLLPCSPLIDVSIWMNIRGFNMHALKLPQYQSIKIKN